MMASTAKSLSHLLDKTGACHAAAGRTALLGRFGTVSYAELLAKIRDLAAVFRGLKKGERVGMLTSRSPDAVALFFGLMKAGGCPCFLEPGLDTKALCGRMAAVGLRRLVLEGEAETLAGDFEGGVVTVHCLASMLSRETDSGGDGKSLTADDLAMMQFTSGSTGQPRGVLLTHGNLCSNADGIIARTSLGPRDRLLHVMPLHHTNGVNNQLVAPLIAGASIVLVEAFRATDIEGQIAEYGATYMTGVPTMYSRVLPHLHDRANRRSLKFLRCGSAPITVSLHRQIEAAFEVPLIVSYGVSEATCTSTMNPPTARRIGSVGTVLRGQEIRLFRPGTGEEVAEGCEGEIAIGGPSVMRGYVGDVGDQPVLDGWLRSGDLGQVDRDGYLIITGRLKDVIIRAGENLSPPVIEAVLEQHPAVRACCVVGVPHVDLGEVPVAFIQARPEERVSVDELKALVGAELSRIYIPSDIRFVEAWPETSIGKVDRRALKAVLGVA